MLLGDHVLGVKGQEIVVILVQAAVLTATCCPLPHERSERRHPSVTEGVGQKLACF